MNLTTITDDCLARLAHGESVADCLARYPEAAEQLAPMLSAAVQLAAFSQARLNDGQRLRAKVTLREELAAQRAQHGRSKHALGITGWARLRVAPLSAMVAVLLFVTVAFSTVAASQPGDLAYPVRVAVERAPALVQPSPARRAAAELAAADRRLTDLARDEAGDPVAVGALLRSDQAAVERAAALGEAERGDVAARVTAHAEALQRLANQAQDPRAAARLLEASYEALALLGQSDSLVIAPGATTTATPTATRRAAIQTPRPGPGTSAVVTPFMPPTLAPTRVLPAPTGIVVPPAIAPVPTAGIGDPVPTATPQTRPRLSVTPPVQLTRTPVLPGTGDQTPTPGIVRPRPTLPVMPPVTPHLRPTLPVMPPVATQVGPATRTAPTARPTRGRPTEPPEAPTGTPGQSSVNTPTPTSWWSTPTVTSAVPTWVAPTATPRPVSTVRPTATVAWATFTPVPVATAWPTATSAWVTFTPAPTATPRPDYQATATATAITIVQPTQAVTPEVTHTPRRQRTATPTPGSPGVASTSTPVVVPATATAGAAPTQPPVPR